MQDKDYNMLLEAYSKINEDTHDIPPLKTTGSEWHEKGEETPPNPKPDLKHNPFKSMGNEPSEPSLANKIDEVLEEWDPNLNHKELAKAIGEIFKKHYMSQKLPPIEFLSAIERAIKS
jgi:hypothetical protein